MVWSEGSSMIRSELILLAASFLFGAGIILSYGVVELLRTFFTRGKGIRILSELIYWTLAAAIAFQLQFRLNDGILRLYSLLGAAVGLCFLRLLTGKIFFTLTLYAQSLRRKRAIRRRNRRKAFQKQLQNRYNQVRMKLLLLKTSREAKKQDKKEP